MRLQKAIQSVASVGVRFFFQRLTFFLISDFEGTVIDFAK